MRRLMAFSWLVVLLMGLAAAPVLAQTLAQTTPAQPQQSSRPPLAFGPKASERVAPPAPQTMSGRLWLWLQQKQAELHRGLIEAVKRFKTVGPWTAAWLLAVASFLYGVFHAAGPGHGKAVISSYVLANERTVRRGIALSFLAAGFQALSAIAMVGVLAVVLNATGMQMKRMEAWLETLSWGFVALLGAWMLWGHVNRHVVPALRRARARGPMHSAGAAAAHGDDHLRHGLRHHIHEGPVHEHASGHAHHRDHGHEPHGHTHHHGPGLQGAHHHAGHHPHHAHDHSECCGHAHMPRPDQLEGAWSWRKALALAVSVGIRPCTGAILVLVFALSQGLWWAGVMATFAMALGTAITVSLLAAVAVGSRELAARLAGGGDGRWGRRVQATAGITGSLLVLVLGSLFFLASLGQSAPF